MGIKCKNILKSLTLNDTQLENYDEVIKAFDSYFKPRRNKIRIRKKYHQMIFLMILNIRISWDSSQKY